jgi:hypothetical protein
MIQAVLTEPKPHKIRTALIEPETKLGGIVEVDKTFIGGKAKNISTNAAFEGTGATRKSIVVGAA